MVLLADLRIADLAVPADPFALPATGVDAGVLPYDMVDHLRIASRFPVSPTIRGASPPFALVDGGRCIWAGSRVAWERPIRCVVDGPPPPGVATLTLSKAMAEDAAADDDPVCSAAFARPLGAMEQKRVEARLAAFVADLAAAAGVGPITLRSLRWERPDLLRIEAPFATVPAGPFGRGLSATFEALRADGIELRAWNGRVLL
jgi:hypothetical protein